MLEKQIFVFSVCHWNIMVAQLTRTAGSTYPSLQVNLAIYIDIYIFPVNLLINRINWFIYYVILT